MKAISCPNCGAPYNPKLRNCEYCGSYLIFTDKNEENYINMSFEVPADKKNYNGIYVYGIRLVGDEKPIRMGVANYSKSAFNTVGGHLLLTNKRLIFISHGMNFGGKIELELNLNDLIKAEVGANLIISGKFSVTDKYNKNYSYVVYGRHEWADMTKSEIQSYKSIQTFSQDNINIASSDFNDKLLKLHSLKNEGILTEEEYNDKKREILSRI